MFREKNVCLIVSIMVDNNKYTSQMYLNIPTKRLDWDLKIYT